MILECDLRDQALIITVPAARIDASVAVQFKDAFREAVKGAPQRVILDLKSVNFVDSSGLGAIVAAMKILAPDGRLELASLSETVSKVFRLTRMDTVFTLHDNVEAALSETATAR
ncbi:MAG: STAS domain-containing protein [Pseudomonadota bacterium]